MKLDIGIYVKNSVEAVKLYKKAFSLELGYHVLNPDGSYYHSELYRGDEEIMDVIEYAESAGHNVQIGVTLDGVDEVRRAYDLLRDGGKVETPIGPLPWSPCAAVVTDKFGVWWYITAPQHYPDADFDPTKPLN